MDRILLIEDDASLRALVKDTLSEDGHQVEEVDDGKRALDILAKQLYRVVISDLNLPGASGMEVLDYLKEHAPNTPFILMTAFGSVDAAVEAMAHGAYDFQEKPLNLDRLRHTVKRALQKASLHNAYDYLRHEQPYIYDPKRILAQSPAMKRVMEQVGRVAPNEATVLLTGETGTGKSMICGAIHAGSPRRNHPLVTVNCAALPETLLESELFGHERGAFTGAHKTRTGRFEQAHGGTLFLDEVGDMSAATQAKVLRAIEDKIIQRVGGARQAQVDVRILAATNRDLEKGVADKSFREDLFYRLNVASIHLPPLRDRGEDIIPLANLFLNQLSKDMKRPAEFSLDESAQQALLDYQWPGNIRELRNIIERATLFARSTRLSEEDLNFDQRRVRQSRVTPATLNLEKLERLAVEEALRQCKWVQNQAAVLLGITPRALSYKIKRLNIDHPGLRVRQRRRD